KLMVLAIVVGIGSTIFVDIATPPTGDIDLRHAASIILAAIAVFGLAVFVPGIAAGLVSGAPQLGAGAAAGTAAGLIGAGVAGGAIASGSARAVGRAGGSAITSAASLSGRASAGYESGGLPGIAKATIGRATSNTASRMSAPIKDAHAHGAAEGYRATGGSSSSSSAGASGRGAGVVNSPSRSSPPPWAKQMHNRQRIREAGMIATHTLRDGDRGGSGEGPKLDPDK
ncbi:MAG: P-type conjugative transfer protein TrbL, partial [Alphaproteobacteria bacterium]|nr:P-type conjugative transfer protein TrbL [Alphaproteobacteria bacterium]